MLKTPFVAQVAYPFALIILSCCISTAQEVSSFCWYSRSADLWDRKLCTPWFYTSFFWPGWIWHLPEEWNANLQGITWKWSASIYYLDGTKFEFRNGRIKMQIWFRFELQITRSTLYLECCYKCVSWGLASSLGWGVVFIGLFLKRKKMVFAIK